jgi:hypothetical protein
MWMQNAEIKVLFLHFSAWRFRYTILASGFLPQLINSIHQTNYMSPGKLQYIQNLHVFVTFFSGASPAAGLNTWSDHSEIFTKVLAQHIML